MKTKFKITTAYVLILMLLLSLMIFPDLALGKENNKNLVAIKTVNGKYLSAKDGGGSTVNATKDKIGEWETFEIIELGKGYIALKSYNGNYLRSTKDGEAVYSDSKEIGKRQAFELVALKNSKIAFKTYDNKYLCAEDGGGGKVVANRQNIGSWETFEFVKIPIGDYDKCELTAVADEKSVTFTWSKPINSQNIIGYNLYRGTSPGNQSSTPITDFFIEGNSYIDKNIKSNTTYYYFVKVVYRDETLGPASNEVSVKSGSRTTKIVLEVGSKYMIVNGQKKEIDPGKGTEVIIKNGRTFLPIRAVIEAMGGEVDWRQNDQRVSIYLKNSDIHLWIGNKNAKVNGVNKETDVAPYISDSGRTMLPLRFIAENLDCEVDWDGLTKTVTITTVK